MAFLLLKMALSAGWVLVLSLGVGGFVWGGGAILDLHWGFSLVWFGVLGKGGGFGGWGFWGVVGGGGGCFLRVFLGG